MMLLVTPRVVRECILLEGRPGTKHYLGKGGEGRQGKGRQDKENFFLTFFQFVLTENWPSTGQNITSPY